MKQSIIKELASYLLDLIEDNTLNNKNYEDWHFLAFNEDYYIIGYYDASQWLREHDIDPFDAIGICQDYERDIFGECFKTYDNSETTVNMLVYIFGEELLFNSEADNIEDLKNYLNEI